MPDKNNSIFNEKLISEESSVDSKQRKYKAIDIQSSYEFDSYYEKHMKIPGTDKK